MDPRLFRLCMMRLSCTKRIGIALTVARAHRLWSAALFIRIAGLRIKHEDAKTPRPTFFTVQLDPGRRWLNATAEVRRRREYSRRLREWTRHLNFRHRA